MEKENRNEKQNTDEKQSASAYHFSLYRFLASVCVACFIVCFAVFLTAKNRSVFGHCAKSLPKGEEMIAVTSEEAKLYYGQIADSFCSFWGKGYALSGYELSAANTAQLNGLKAGYRRAVVIALLAFCGGVYCFLKLARRRDTAPLAYGSALAGFLTALSCLFLVFSKKEISVGLRNMIFRQDYGYFASGDILTSILPETYAKELFLYYLLMVFVLIGIMVLIRFFAKSASRPHKY